MKLTTFKNGSRLAIPAIFAALFLVASTVTLYYYSATLSKKGLYAIAGTQERGGHPVPLTGPEEVLWRLLALAPGVGVTLFGEWSDAGLAPGSIVDGRVRPL